MMGSQREEGASPATGTQNILGPSLPAGSRLGNTLHPLLPSLAAAVQIPKDAADTRPAECRACLRYVMRG